MASKAKSKVSKKTRVATLTNKQSGSIARPLKFDAVEVVQSSHKVYLFTARASVLYSALSINRRVEDKDEGYQRTLSVSRVGAITRHILAKRALPSAIIVCFDNARFDSTKGELNVPKGTDVGWVIDGQHRLAGAEQAARQSLDIELPVIAFLGLSETAQIEQFVVINREAKNVSTSLYLDLLGKLPNKKPGDFAKERAADLATQLRKEESSPFFERIVVTVSPREGQLSMTNFVRKIAPHVVPDKGILNSYSEREQYAVMSNYFEGLRQVFNKEFERKGSAFFKTVGFGALWNIFPLFFSLTLKNHSGFTVKDVVAVFKRIEDFDFSAWTEYGSGNQAELTAGDDLKTSLLISLNEDGVNNTLRV